MLSVLLNKTFPSFLLQLAMLIKYLILIFKEFNYIRNGFQENVDYNNKYAIVRISASITLHKYQLLPRLHPICYSCFSIQILIPLLFISGNPNYTTHENEIYY